MMIIIMMTTQFRWIEQTRDRQEGKRDSNKVSPIHTASRNETQLKIECTFLFLATPFHLPLFRILHLFSSVCLLGCSRCGRMKYCPEGRYNFDAFTTFRVLVIIGSLCLEVSFMIGFLFSWFSFFIFSCCCLFTLCCWIKLLACGLCVRIWSQSKVNICIN